MLHVVIATRGRARLLERTLSSLAACDRPASYAGTLVVENGDQRGCEQIVQNVSSRLNATYLFHRDANKSASLNAALGRIHKGLIVFLDDDVIVDRMLLRAYAAAATGISGGVFFGGPVFPDYEIEPPAWLVPHLPYSARGWLLENDAGPVTTPAFLGANWAAFVSDLNNLGGFNPLLGPGAATGSVGQERAMQKRLLAAGGMGRYVPDAKVWHWVPRERCTPRWALYRMYRDGISRGLDDDGAPASPRILGYPRWAIRRTATHALRALGSCARPRSKGNIEAIRQLLLSAGYLKGSRLAYRKSVSEAAAEHVELN